MKNRWDPEPPCDDGLIAGDKTIITEDPNNLAAITALVNADYDIKKWKKQ